MTDQELIDRLRHYAQIAHAAASWGFAGEGEVMNRAADLITALLAKNAALEPVTQPAQDAAAIREALLSLPAVYAHQISTGVREVYDPLQRFYRMEDVLSALAEGTIWKSQTVADDWECPIGAEGCHKNCGSYGCGN